ncbi:unnamed protein product [Cuscuta epithymum]|uniref:RRM domain-containing protein n=1 Tax=Cuscuta epithymum TaxID=186058 RepID=A0AAV0DPF4_9ASTE|nr:unnamed protein product [Cuscuta epithymum]
MTMSTVDDSNGGGGAEKAAGFGDTTLTKVFVGGLAWETPKEALRDHFHKFGDILEAVIISNKLTGRSKGYGFVTFKDAEAAKKACEEATPMIHGRRANCNLASLGARRPRPPYSSTTSPPPQGPNVVGPRTLPANHVQFIYQSGASPPPPPPLATSVGGSQFLHPNHHRQAVPLYGYPASYVGTDLSYNHKVGYGGGAYMNGQFYPGQQQHMMGGNAFVPALYPLYQFPYHTMGLPAHMYYPTTSGPLPSVPALFISKAPTPGTVGNVEGLKRVVVKST